MPKDIRSSSQWRRCCALLGLGMLAQRSELVVMQASGFTRLQVALAVMKTAIPLVLLTMAIGEWVAPQGEQMARTTVPSRWRRLAAQPSRAVGERWPQLCLYRTRKGNDELGASASCLQPGASFTVGALCRFGKFDSENKVWRLSRWMNPT